jgi:hypothetical protein
VIFIARADELRRIVADAEPALVVASPLVSETAEAAANGTRVVTDLAKHECGAPLPIVPRADDNLAALVYTGGTTGRAKGVMLTHANIWEAGRAGHQAGHVEGIDRSLTCLPLSHSYGLLVLNVGLHPPRPAAVGADALVHPRGVARARAGAPEPDRGRRAVDAAHAAPGAARGLRPLRAALRRVRRGAPRGRRYRAVPPPGAGS